MPIVISKGIGMASNNVEIVVDVAWLLAIISFIYDSRNTSLQS